MLLGLVVLVPRFLPSPAMPSTAGGGDLNCFENRIDSMIFFSDLRSSSHFSSAPNNFCHLSVADSGDTTGISSNAISHATTECGWEEFSGKLTEFDRRISTANAGFRGTSQENLRRYFGFEEMRIRRLTVPSERRRLFVTMERMLSAIFVFHGSTGDLRLP
ncbi:hypothetical protein NE237_020829 [Protea cynaroides]|uniref:Uncharacterized protein n=1 Tax=Protea cynaroides TaxID=273540 RepID=A0A9Q0K214_9MAGN|nr:hypothetical protein NE237_020829 [Protea cynaroides]